MQDFDRNTDTLGNPANGRVWVRLRPDTPAGVGLGNGRSLAPGESAAIPAALAQRLVRNGKASYVTPPAPAPAPAPEVIAPDVREPAAAKRPQKAQRGRR